MVAKVKVKSAVNVPNVESAAIVVTDHGVDAVGVAATEAGAEVVRASEFHRAGRRL
jgi:hypothetical protein